MSAIPVVPSNGGAVLSGVPLHRPICQQLQQHYQIMRTQHMRDLFAADPQRFVRFSLHVDDLLLDYSKNRITEKTLSGARRRQRRTGACQRSRSR